MDGTEAVIGRPSMGRKALNIMKDFATDLDMDEDDTIDIDLDIVKNLTNLKPIGHVDGSDKEDDDDIPHMDDFDSDDEDENYEPKTKTAYLVSIPDPPNLSKKDPIAYTNGIIEEARDFFQSASSLKPEVIKKINQLQPVVQPTCPLSDEDFHRISECHCNHKGHIKNDRLRDKVNEDLPEESQLSLKQVQNFVKFCPECQKLSTSFPVPNFKYHPSVEKDRLDTVLVDVIVIKRGWNVFVAYNAGSKEMQYEELKDMTAAELHRAIFKIRATGFKLNRIYLRADKGSNQTATEVQILLEQLKNSIQFSIADSHQDNAEIERQFLEIRRHLIPLFQEQAQTHGDELRSIALAEAFTIYNSIRSNLGVAPWEIARPLDWEEFSAKIFDTVPEITASELKLKVEAIQRDILDKIILKQTMLFSERANAKQDQGGEIPLIKPGMLVLLDDESRENKVAYRLKGPEICVSIDISPITKQPMARLRDPTGTMEDQLVHLKRLKQFNYDARCGMSLAQIKSLDMGEMVVVKILSHVTRNPEQPQKLLDYDFKVQWINGIESYIDWKETSKLQIFQDYLFEHKEEFEDYFKRLSTAERKKVNIPVTVFQERRKKVSSSINALTFLGNRDWNGLNDKLQVGVTEDLFHNVNNLSFDDIVNKIADKFHPEALAEGARENLIKRMSSNPGYPKVLSDLTKGDFLKGPDVILKIDESKLVFQPIRQIRNPKAKLAYEQYIVKLLREGRIQQLPQDTVILFNNTPHMVIDAIINANDKWRLTFDAYIRNNATEPTPWFSRKTLAERNQDMGKEWKNKADAKSAFWQVRIHDDSRKYLQWICPVTGKKYEMLGMDMGGLNSPAELQNRIDAIFEGSTSYIDDFMFSENTIDESLDRFMDIMDKCLQYNFKLNYDKIELLQKQIENLGRFVDNDKIFLNKETRDKIMAAKLPRSPTELQSFLGLINWGGPNIIDLKSKPVDFKSYLTKELTPMINEGTRLNWTPEREKAFYKLIDLAANNMPLHFFDEDEEIYVAVDACKRGTGGIIFHLNKDGSKRIFGISSTSFTKEEQDWTTNDQEAFAIVTACKAFQHFLFGRHFNLFTDHKNLTYIHSASSSRIVRWKVDLSRYSFTAYHIPGRLNWEADFLSRIETDNQRQEVSFNGPTLVPWGSVNS